MKKILFVLIAFACANTSFSQDVSQKLDELMSAYAKMDRFNGTVLVAKKGVVLLEKGYGYRGYQKKYHE
jgi:CubicO group peptidase (beta-lactamase class C family)